MGDKDGNQAPARLSAADEGIVAFTSEPRVESGGTCRGERPRERSIIQRSAFKPAFAPLLFCRYGRVQFVRTCAVAVQRGTRSGVARRSCCRRTMKHRPPSATRIRAKMPTGAASCRELQVQQNTIGVQKSASRLQECPCGVLNSIAQVRETGAG